MSGLQSSWAALDFLCIDVEDFLFQTETLVAEVYCTGADGNPVSTFYLGKNSTSIFTTKIAY